VDDGRRLKLTVLVSEESSQISPAEGAVYIRISGLINEFYPGVITSPYLVMDGTDVRKYCRISDYIYCFTPAFVTNEEKDATHKTNESISAANYARMARVYSRFIRDFDNRSSSMPTL
jgi:carboxypeptidase PM20D1